MAIVGIDLGTTNSLIAVFEESGPRLLPNALGQVLTPSAVSVDDAGTVLVGQAARDRLVSHPEQTVAAFKRWMGTRHEVRLGGRSFRPEELSALVLRSLIADAEAALGEKVHEAVISVPAYFSDAQRKATQAAGALAGIKVERLINEPTAAALAYGLESRGDGTQFVVCDLGGGTFDVTILEMFDGVVEVHATAGDNFLGGEDFLEVLVQAFCADQKLDPHQLAPRELGVIRHRCEILKRRLSDGTDFSLEIPVQGQMVPWRMDVARFEKLCEPLLQRLRAPLERALRDAQLKASDLDEVILVGGASRMPQMVKLASRLFGRLPLRHIKPDESIALGAAVAAGLKARHAALEEVILTDVCPYTLGLAVSQADGRGGYLSGFFQPIIPRNCTVPVSRENSFSPLTAEQTVVLLPVYQGENPRVEKNIRLGELSVPLPARRPGDSPSVNVRFTYDVNGVLQVEAVVEGSDERHELILQQQGSRLSDEEIRQRLAALSALKVHPRDKQENLALLARAERLYEELIHARDYIQQWLGSFQRVLETQDEAEIAPARVAFAAALDQVEAVGR